MKPTGHTVCVFILAIGGAVGSPAAIVTWDGGGGDFSWQNATNWSRDALPWVNNDVVINAADGITVTSGANVTIASLQCSNNLALSGGMFRVRAGSSIVQGGLLTTGNPTFSATGDLTSFMIAGPVNADGASFEAIDATLSLPGLSTYSKGAGCAFVAWSAQGSTGVLDFPSLTVVTGAVCAHLTIQALDGGTLLLPGLTTTEEGTTFIIADGAGSLVDLPVAQRSLGTTRAVTFEARNQGNISMPQFTGGQNVVVALRTNACGFGLK